MANEMCPPPYPLGVNERFVWFIYPFMGLLWLSTLILSIMFYKKRRLFPIAQRQPYLVMVYPVALLVWTTSFLIFPPSKFIGVGMFDQITYAMCHGVMFLAHSMRSMEFLFRTEMSNTMEDFYTDSRADNGDLDALTTSRIVQNLMTSNSQSQSNWFLNNRFLISRQFFILWAVLHMVLFITAAVLTPILEPTQLHTKYNLCDSLILTVSLIYMLVNSAFIAFVLTKTRNYSKDNFGLRWELLMGSYSALFMVGFVTFATFSEKINYSDPSYRWNDLATVFIHFMYPFAYLEFTLCKRTTFLCS